MNCMKCGRELNEEQEAFCQYCQLEMEDYPVKPNTVVLLPDKKPAEPKRQPRRRKQELSLEEQLPVLKTKLLALRLISLVLVLFLSVLGFITYRALSELDIQRLLGQNYSSITPTEPESTDSQPIPSDQ